MEKITFKIKPESKRNEMHFEVQQRTRAHVFVDRKKREKSGYRKHKRDFGA